MRERGGVVVNGIVIVKLTWTRIFNRKKAEAIQRQEDLSRVIRLKEMQVSHERFAAQQGYLTACALAGSAREMEPDPQRSGNQCDDYAAKVSVLQSP
jgi:hypothetical protein